MSSLNSIENQLLASIKEEQIILNSFALGRTIGQGTFNKVKIAKHLLTNEQVAIKMIEKSKIQSTSDQLRLNRELKILRKVRHPNISQLFQILEDEQFYYMVTQYAMRGQLFEHIVKQQKLTEFQASKFLQQLLDAVQYMHQIGVVHRDLKPENLLLDYKYNLKVIDFGLSNIYSKGQTLKTACGSPCYAAPEMLKGEAYNGLKIDIWSIGIILYAMCFGYLPFDDTDSTVLYQKIIEGTYQIPDHASEELISILRILLEVDPSKRATISEIRCHKFCKFSPIGFIPGIIVGLSDIPFETQIETEMIEMNIDTGTLRDSIKNNKHNELTVTYYLLLQRNLRLQNKNVITYYTDKNYIINRYALIQKVKINYQKRLQNRLEHLKNQTISDQVKQKRSKTTDKKILKNTQKNLHEVTHKKILFESPNKKRVSSINKTSSKKRQTSRNKRLSRKP